MLHKDRHLTTEQLSAFLDQQLPAPEQAMCQAHLDTCAECRQELAGLRRTVTLLRSLPAAPLPRSFLLPLDTTAQPLPQSEEREDDSVPASQDRRPARRLVVLRVAVRTMSTLAAVIGAFFLLSALLATISLPHGASTASNSAPQAVPQQQPATEADQRNAVPGSTTPQPQKTPTTSTYGQAATPAASQSSNGNQGRSQQPPQTLHFPTIPFLDLNTPEGRLGVGFLLLMFGIMGLIITRRGDRLYPVRR